MYECLYRWGKTDKSDEPKHSNILACTITWRIGLQPLIYLSASLYDRGIEKTWATADIDASDLLKIQKSLDKWMVWGKERTGYWVGK